MAGKRNSQFAEWTARKQATDDLCARIEDGESLTAIAKDLGCNVSTLTRWIAGDPQRSARARESRIAAAGSYADLALQVLQDAPDPFALAKAREVASHYRWQASKANPAAYGERTTLAGDPNAPLVVSQAQRDAAVKAAGG